MEGRDSRQEIHTSNYCFLMDLVFNCKILQEFDADIFLVGLIEPLAEFRGDTVFAVLFNSQLLLLSTTKKSHFGLR